MKMRYAHFEMFANFLYRGLDNLELYCILTIEAWRKLNMHFDNYKCMHIEIILNLIECLEMDQNFNILQFFFFGQRSGSVVECLTQDRGAAGSSLTGVTALWYLSKTHLS